MFQTLVFRCSKEHEWRLVLAKYWFSVKCPDCGLLAVSVKAGDPVERP